MTGRPRASFLVLGATAVIAAANAAHSPMTKAAFLKQGNAICAKANQRIERLGLTYFKSPGNPTRAEVVSFAREVAVPITQGTLNQLRKLSPPKADEARVKEILDASQAAVDKVKAHPSLLGGNNGSDRANQLARAYGLTACAN